MSSGLPTVQRVEAVVRPRLRGWLHAGTTPLALAAGIVLVALAPAGSARAASAVYASTCVLLFGVSAVYHRRQWGPRAHAVLKRLDHSNIFLIIAGTYTPFAVLLLTGSARAWLLGLVWSCALAGVLFRVLWTSAPRWLYVPVYVVLGWVAVLYLPAFLHRGGVAVLVLLATGGLLYTLGGVVYGFRRPDPFPRWFGFHEVFHTLTIAGWTVQYVAASLVVYSAR